MIIFLIGFMGSGKTYHAKRLAARLNVPWFDLDEVIEDEEGRTIVAIFENYTESGFREIESRVLRRLVEDICVRPEGSAVVACGGGTPCFHDNMLFMNEQGITVWLNPPVDAIFERLILEKEHRPLINNKDDAELKNFIAGKLLERKLCYEQARLEIQESDINAEDLINLIGHAKKLS